MDFNHHLDSNETVQFKVKNIFYRLLQVGWFYI